jgi:hypothetical protein
VPAIAFILDKFLKLQFLIPDLVLIALLLYWEFPQTQLQLRLHNVHVGETVSWLAFLNHGFLPPMVAHWPVDLSPISLIRLLASLSQRGN